jgi:hypothetical protein
MGAKATRKCMSPSYSLQERRGSKRDGSANGNRTRITALKGRCANRCTMAPRQERARNATGSLQRKLLLSNLREFTSAETRADWRERRLLQARAEPRSERLVRVQALSLTSTTSARAAP